MVRTYTLYERFYSGLKFHSCLNTERAYKRQGHVTFEALCWLFSVMAERPKNDRTTVEVLEK